MSRNMIWGGELGHIRTNCHADNGVIIMSRGLIRG
jgi:hypothetical protein